MTVKALDEVTVTDLTDIDSLVTWYALTSSTTPPTKPSTTQTSASVSSPWTTTEPSFDPAQGTRYLYTVVQTRWKDGSCTWGDVQLSSSYEQAKAAWNKANSASAAAEDGAKTATNFIAIDTNDGSIHIANDSPSTSDTYQRQTSTETEFVVDGVSRATISGSGARFGKAYDANSNSNESHLELDYHSLQLVNREGETYFHVSDLRNSDGIIVESFVGDGTNRTFKLATTADSVVYVKVDGVETTYSLNNHEYVILPTNQTPADNASVVVEYVPNTAFTNAYTLGYRGQGFVGMLSVAEGRGAVAAGNYSHVEGYDCETKYGSGSHAEGYKTEAFATTMASHSEGAYTTANGDGAHAEGYYCEATAPHAHAEGRATHATYDEAHAQNFGTIAAKRAQTAIGTCNVEDTSSTTTHPLADSDAGKYAFIIGNGTANARSNAAVIDWLGNYIGQAMAGIIQMFAGATPPSGWLVCDGSAVSRTTYATLFAAIGTTWGTGDGSTTFNLPDLRGRAPIGAGTGSGLTERTLGTQNIGSENVQAHTHSISRTTNVAVSDSGHTHPAATSDYYYALGSATFAKQSGTAQSGSSGLTNAVRQSGTVSSNKNTGSGKASLSVTQPVFSVGAVSGATTGTAGNMQPSAVVNFIICTGKTS